MGDADAQPLVARSAVRSLSAQAAREHGKVRTEDPFGTPGHDEGNLVFDRARGEAQIRRQRIAQDRHSIFAGEIVDPAVASVLPSTARIDDGETLPASISRMRPETSPGPLVGMRTTSTEIAGMVTPHRRLTRKSIWVRSSR
jgi:hypothetical protein